MPGVHMASRVHVSMGLLLQAAAGQPMSSWPVCRYGHEDAVACVALCVDQDLVVSAAQDGTMLFHTLSHGRYGPCCADQLLPDAYALSPDPGFELAQKRLRLCHVGLALCWHVPNLAGFGGPAFRA